MCIIELSWINSEREKRKRREGGMAGRRRRRAGLKEMLKEMEEKKNEQLLHPQPFQGDLYFEGNPKLINKALMMD